MKTLRYKFRKMLRAHRSENKGNEASSVTLKDLSDLNHFPDDLIVAQDEDEIGKKKCATNWRRERRN